MAVWLILLGILLVFGLPAMLVVMGVALALWLCLAVAGLVWSIFTFVFGWPVLGILAALGIGIWIGRAKAPPASGAPGRPWR